MIGIDFVLLVCVLIAMNLFFIVKTFSKIQKIGIILFRTGESNRKFNSQMLFLMATFIATITVNVVLLAGELLFNIPTVCALITFFEIFLLLLFLVFERAYRKTTM